MKIYNCDCVGESDRLDANSVDLGIFDPPFGIAESDFDKHYNRNSQNVIPGYQEAPKDYYNWTKAWLTEAKRVLKDNGSMYVFMGHTNLRYLLNAAHDVGLREINHLIWKYNFGVNTTKKYVTSHYHVLYYAKDGAKPTFNTYCRFGQQERDNGSLLYRDLEDVFVINKEYSPGERKNQNKLPESIIQKLIMYSSNQDEVVCDFFMGNFTTAYVATKLGRKVCGYEINKNSYDYHIDKLKDVEFGSDLKLIKQVESGIPENQGKPITLELAQEMCQMYKDLIASGLNKGKANKELQIKYGRGRFSIKNMLDRHLTWTH